MAIFGYIITGLGFMQFFVVTSICCFLGSNINIYVRVFVEIFASFLTNFVFANPYDVWDSYYMYILMARIVQQVNVRKENNNSYFLQ